MLQPANACVANLNSRSYKDQFDSYLYRKSLLGDFTEDYTTLTWVNGSDLRYGLHQLMTHRPWHSCERLPAKCAKSPIMYPIWPNKNPHSSFVKGGTYFIIPNQRYGAWINEEDMGPLAPVTGNEFKFELKAHAGRWMPGDWIEFETRPKQKWLSQQLCVHWHRSHRRRCSCLLSAVSHHLHPHPSDAAPLIPVLAAVPQG